MFDSEALAAGAFYRHLFRNPAVMKGQSIPKSYLVQGEAMSSNGEEDQPEGSPFLLGEENGMMEIAR